MMSIFSESIFDCKYEFQPAIIQEVVNDNNEVVETIFKPIKKETKNKYLPGERLLRSINKDALKKKQYKKESIHLSTVNQIEKSLQNLLKEF